MHLISSTKKVYQPSIFWEKASEEITSEFNEHGLSNFRRLPSSLRFFVPTYGRPGNGFKTDQIKKILNFLKKEKISEKQMLLFQSHMNGEQAAIADYRALLASCSDGNAKSLLDFSESAVGNPIEQFNFEGKAYSRASLNYLLGLALLSKHTSLSEVTKVVEIGGGFGSLGEISIKSLNISRYINIDIYPTLSASEYYLSTKIGRAHV